MTALQPENLCRLRAVLEANTESFTRLASLGGLAPATSFRGADLRYVDFATDDLSGYDFSGADLTGSNLSGARTTTLLWNSRTIWPSDWHLPLWEAAWADDWGMDRYGAWASFDLPRSDGSRVTQRLRWAPPGGFVVESSPGEDVRLDGVYSNGHFIEETRQAIVAYMQGFWMFETACTEALWESVTGERPPDARGETFPATNVSWNDTQDFIRKLNNIRPELALSLPSELQWEFACRAGAATAYSFGDEINPTLARYGTGAPVPAGHMPPNIWGLREMHGNVWEWCADTDNNYLNGSGYLQTSETSGYIHEFVGCHQDTGIDNLVYVTTNYDAVISSGNQLTAFLQGKILENTSYLQLKVPNAAELNTLIAINGGTVPYQNSMGFCGQIVRGGSFRSEAQHLRAGYRGHCSPEHRDVDLGFRCVRVLQANDAGPPVLGHGNRP